MSDSTLHIGTLAMNNIVNDSNHFQRSQGCQTTNF